MVRVQLLPEHGISEILDGYINKEMSMYIFSIIFVGAALSKIFFNKGNEENWPVITRFFWILAALFQISMVAALWLLPTMPWIGINMSYFMLGCITCFIAVIQNKQVKGGGSPLQLKGPHLLIPVVITFLITNLLGHQFKLHTKYRVFCVFAGIANALTVEMISMMVGTMKKNEEEKKKD